MSGSQHLWALSFALVAAAGCQQRAQAPQVPAARTSTAQAATKPVQLPAPEQSAQQPQQLTAAHLPNPWRIHPQVISGGLPEGDAAFAELAALGVKTIISVDGMAPDVAAAKKHGLRYVHLPHGYDGVPSGRGMELAKAVRDLPGPIYIHCHHGKHRSPAAAAVACVAAGLIDPSAAETILKTAGTSAAYQGLYQSAREARRLDDKLLDELKADFPERAAVPPLAEAMVAVEKSHEHLTQIAAAGWKAPPQHPDLDPAHEALLLREHFTELMRHESVKTKPPAFQSALADSERAAKQLERALTGQSPAERLTAAFQQVSRGCVDCHRVFRDVPLKEK